MENKDFLKLFENLSNYNSDIRVKSCENIINTLLTDPN